MSVSSHHMRQLFFRKRGDLMLSRAVKAARINVRVPGRTDLNERMRAQWPAADSSSGSAQARLLGMPK